MPFMPRAAIAASHLDACLPVQEIVQFVGAFWSRYRTVPSGFHHWHAVQKVPR